MSTELTSLAKYSRPRIVTIGLPSQVTSSLEAARYTADTGIFGKLYRVARSKNLIHVNNGSILPEHLSEKDIVIVQTWVEESPGSPPSIEIGDGVDVLWQECSSGSIDTRVIGMAGCRGDIDRIVEHGGIVIASVANRHEREYILGHRSVRSVNTEKEFKWHSWGFLSEMDNFQVEGREGKDFKFLDHPLAQLLKRHSRNAEFHCVFSPYYTIEKRFIPLATNKFDEVVAGVLFNESGRPFLLLIPEIPDLHLMIPEFLENFAATWSPELFPELDGKQWVYRDDYELPEIVKISAAVEQKRTELANFVKEADQKIIQLREKNSARYALLTETGDALVAAVIQTLKSLGFEKVVDVDAAVKKERKGGTLKEDIQIHDRQPVLIVDVKGVLGNPADDESLQADKHATMRIKEWKSIEVQGLTIINSQRGIPPLDRHQQAYRSEIIGAAEEQKLGLITTWDIFNIQRNAETLSWPKSAVLDIFYRVGRIEPIPSHYVSIGTIAHAWKHAIGLLPMAEVSVGDKVAILRDYQFTELTISSLKVDGKDVQTAAVGSNCGIACSNDGKSLHVGDRVFKVSAH